jgi:hypothetical protein
VQTIGTTKKGKRKREEKKKEEKKKKKGKRKRKAEAESRVVFSIDLNRGFEEGAKMKSEKKGPMTKKK